MLLLAIMGTDVVQLESRLVEEDLLLCNIKRGEKGRGEGECKLFPGSSREFLASSVLPTHWASSRLGAWPRADPGLKGALPSLAPAQSGPRRKGISLPR